MVVQMVVSCTLQSEFCTKFLARNYYFSINFQGINALDNALKINTLEVKKSSGENYDLVIQLRSHSFHPPPSINVGIFLSPLKIWCTQSWTKYM